MSLSSYKLNASIAVWDMARASEFYEGKLGLAAASTGADGSKIYESSGGASRHV
jgi:catechol-2,3-dioxygenase